MHLLCNRESTQGVVCNLIGQSDARTVSDPYLGGIWQQVSLGGPPEGTSQG